MEDFFEEEQRGDKADDLRDGEGEPDIIQHTGEGEQVRHRNEHDELTAQRDQHAVYAFTQGLEHAAGNDADSGQRVGEGGDAEGRDANGNHGFGGIEQAEQRYRQEEECGPAQQHDGDSGDGGGADGLMDAAAVAGTVIVGDDGNNGIIEAEERHKEKAVELEVDAVDRRRGGAERQQDLIHEVGGDRADGGHQNGGEADGIDLADEGKIETDLFGIDTDIGIVLLIEDNTKHCGDQLTDDGSIGSAPDAHGRAAEEAEDHDGIEDDIDDGADALNEHGDEGLAGALQHPLGGDLHKDADGADADDGKILGAVFRDDGGNTLLHGEVELRAENPKQREYHGGADGKQQADISDFLGGLAVFLAQSAGKQGIHTHAGAGGKGDHEVLNGEGQRNGGEGILADAGDEDAIDDIIKGLDEHGDDERQGHIKNELFDRHCPHFVFFWHGIDGHDDLRKSIFAQIADLTYSILLLNENVNEREKGSLLTFVWIG